MVFEELGKQPLDIIVKYQCCVFDTNKTSLLMHLYFQALPVGFGFSYITSDIIAVKHILI